MTTLVSEKPKVGVESAASVGATLRCGLLSARVVEWPGDEMCEAISRLRYDYFVRRRGWITDDPMMAGLETDAYDAYALHLVVSNAEEIAAYLRVLPYIPEIGFMLDREFACLLNGQETLSLSCSGAVELSRLVFQPPAIQQRHMESRSRELHPVEFLLKLLYRVSLDQGFLRFYVVVEESWIRPFARRFGLAFTAIGAPHVFSDGTRTVAATATLAELQDSMRKHSLAKYNWYHE